MKLNGFGPHLILLASSDQLWNMQLVWISSDEVHESLWSVLGEDDGLLGEDTVVGSLESLSLFKKLDELSHVSELLIMLDDVLKMIWVDDDVQSAELSSSEFLGSDTGEANCLPDLWNICLLCGIISTDVFLVHDEDLSELLVVAKLSEQNLGSLIHLVVEALVTDLLKISLIWFSDEVLEVNEALLSAFGIGINEFRVNYLLLKGFPSHEEELNEVIEAVIIVSLSNDSQIHLRILSLDEAFDTFSQHVLVQLRLTELGPDLWFVGLLCKLLSTLDVVLFVQKHLDGFNVLTELLVDAESFIIELVLIFLSDSCQFISVVVVKSVDVVHDL